MSDDIQAIRRYMSQLDPEIVDMRQKIFYLQHGIHHISKILDNHLLVKPDNYMDRWQAYLKWEVGVLDSNGRMDGNLMVRRYGC